MEATSERRGRAPQPDPPSFPARVCLGMSGVPSRVDAIGVRGWPHIRGRPGPGDAGRFAARHFASTMTAVASNQLVVVCWVKAGVYAVESLSEPSHTRTPVQLSSVRQRAHHLGDAAVEHAGSALPCGHRSGQGATVWQPYSSGATSRSVSANCQWWPARSSTVQSRSPYSRSVGGSSTRAP